ncbi:transcriptional repressor LexA [Halomonas sp. PAR7]|uniref:transcriptional repressor LexA n=1 Tax=Halomonas sp. PAR7 TaxID=3075514 RepID=UPI0028835AA5|nr:transcriptional repressor LexA [Halomonas sp. PAR7]MDT0501785.1 transcriptional repressor LexA [Halomonas sp. PAR7]
MFEASTRYMIRRPNRRLAEAWSPCPLTGDSQDESQAMVDIPLLGSVAAGMPIEACPSVSHIRVPRRMVRRNTYALRVRGDSMVECNIFDGDVIIIEQCESAENGETAVVMINDQEVTLKKLYIEKSGVRLQPANRQMAPIFLKNSDIQVLGMVMGVVRQGELAA